MTETTERVQAQEGDFFECTVPFEDVARWVKLNAAADAAEKRVETLGRAVFEVDSHIEDKAREAADDDSKRGELEAKRRTAAEMKDVPAIRDAAGELAALGAIAEIRAEELEALEARRRELAEKLLPDAQTAAEEARAAADAAYSRKPSRRLVGRLVLWQVARLAQIALAEDDFEDATELVRDLVGLPDQVARNAVEDPEWFAAMLEGMDARSEPLPAKRTPAEREALLRELLEDADREQQVLDAKRWGAEQIMFSQAVQNDTANGGY